MNIIQAAKEYVLHTNNTYTASAPDHYDFWEQHVQFVVKEALFLADKYHADKEFANLSIHYFDEADTLALSREIWRVLKPNGLFIGSVNSSAAYAFIKDQAKVLEDHYYLCDERRIRLFDRPQFDFFFGRFRIVPLEEIRTVRFKNQRDH